MSDRCKPRRIDWFDGIPTEETVRNTSSSASRFTDEDLPDPQTTSKPTYTDKKPIGFKRLLDFSLLKPPILNLEIADRPGFWTLLETKLKGDVIVLIVKILGNIYKSLEPGERSKIVIMLRAKFEKSNFLEVLKEYLIGLPSVRIVDKRMNSHLWNDVQSFYFEVVALCEGIYNFGESSKEYLEKVYDLLEVTETSALGVTKEHRETFSNSFFEKIVHLKSQIMPYTDKQTTVQQKTFSDHLYEQVVQLTSRLSQLLFKTAVDNPIQTSECNISTSIQNTECEMKDKSFQMLSIFPSKVDLLEENSIKILPNIIDGAYPSVKDYLDLQFKLLREDCFGPLREGISKYIENPSKKRHENIRVYPEVRVIRICISNKKVGHLVDISCTERNVGGVVDCRKYALNKQLMFGSLLLFTADNFDTILCATVLDSNLGLLAEGHVAVSFQIPVSEQIFSKPYLMVESEVFFEPYHRVLKVLQNSRLDDLPMRKYIVDVQKETHAPAYLTPHTEYVVHEVGYIHGLRFPVLQPSNWPVPSAIGLDESQMEAFTFALTREFAVIQGPPGTGKTFIGVKIASTLIGNLPLKNTPMLIICYTNHALDQFLEGILNVTTNIVRLGSQSKSEVLKDYTIYNMRSRIKSKYSQLYGMKRSELEEISRQMKDIETDIEKCEKEILSYKRGRSPHNELECGNILCWLFAHLQGDFQMYDWDKQAGNVICFSEESALDLHTIDSMTKNIRYETEGTDDYYLRQIKADVFESHTHKVKKRLNFFKTQISLALYGDKERTATAVTERDVFRLLPQQWWDVYFKAVAELKRAQTRKMNSLMVKHNACSSELDELATLNDGEVLKTARVVGMTTTTAARRHDLMKILKSPIVIVEEAAEVLEAHIVASLTHSCQHLILIGDHKQLRPTAAHYTLAKECNLDISLFERMIRNGVHARTLTTQRRMRPNFAGLLVPVIYEKLDAHPSVYEYEHVRGMRDNLFFYNHGVFEDPDVSEDSWSYKNTHEAKWCVSLANYLRRVEYKEEEITILATYTDQATLIKELSKNYSMLSDIKICSVDNYQGEENRIVILSLVRSNREGKIGFLKAANRICVALSRAKEGFYIFGNMGVLKSASPIWRCINDKLVAQKAIGNEFVLRCDEHENTLEVATTKDLDNCIKGKCLRVCESERDVCRYCFE